VFLIEAEIHWPQNMNLTVKINEKFLQMMNNKKKYLIGERINYK
jgi:hypothetical protein